MIKLKLRVVKFERAIACQIIEQAELPQEQNGHVRVMFEPELCDTSICLRGIHKHEDARLSKREFSCNVARDEYIDRVLGWLDEYFCSGSGEVKQGQKCLVSEYTSAPWKERIFVCKYKGFYYTEHPRFDIDDLEVWNLIKPFPTHRTEPHLDGGTMYIWE